MNKVSVIVATKNGGERLIKTINSFFDQSYSEKELIVVDGGDRTKTEILIERYKNKLIYVWSEPKGISDALNTGLKMASGDYIYIIGAGDYFWSNEVIDKMMNGVNSQKDILVCGRINRTTEDGKKVLYTSSIIFSKWMLLYKMGLPHQGLFTSKKYFELYGDFDTNCKYAMDYELLLRSYYEFPKVVLKDVVVAAWCEGGIGKDNTMKVLNEYNLIRSKNKVAPKILLWIVYILSKLRYLFIK